MPDRRQDLGEEVSHQVAPDLGDLVGDSAPGSGEVEAALASAVGRGLGEPASTVDVSDEFAGAGPSEAGQLAKIALGDAGMVGDSLRSVTSN